MDRLMLLPVIKKYRAIWVGLLIAFLGSWLTTSNSMRASTQGGF